MYLGIMNVINRDVVITAGTRVVNCLSCAYWLKAFKCAVLDWFIEDPSVKNRKFISSLSIDFFPDSCIYLPMYVNFSLFSLSLFPYHSLSIALSLFLPLLSLSLPSLSLSLYIYIYIVNDEIIRTRIKIEYLDPFLRIWYSHDASLFISY